MIKLVKVRVDPNPKYTLDGNWKIEYAELVFVPPGPEFEEELTRLLVADIERTKQ